MAAISTANRMCKRWSIGAILLIVVASLAGGGWWGWQLWSAATPPMLPENLEPAVREHLDRLRTKVVDAPHSGAAWGELGMGLFGNSQREAALICLAEAERLDPDNPVWPHLQAIKFHLDDRMDAAIVCLERAVAKCERQDRDNFVPRLLLAELLLDRYEESRAEAIARGVLEQAPDNARAHYLIGVICNGRDDSASSLKHLTQAAGSPFVRKKAYQQLATLHSRMNQADLAQQFANKAGQLPTDPDWPDPYHRRAMQHLRGSQMHWQAAKELRRDGKLQASLRSYREAAEEARNPSAQVALARTLLDLGDFDLAESVLRNALREQPELVQAYQQLGLVLLEQGETMPSAAAAAKFRDAAAQARRALELQPHNAAAHWVHGLALRRLGQKKEAVLALTEATRLRPERHQYHMHLGEALGENDDIPRALRHLQLAVDLAPANDLRPAATLKRWQERSQGLQGKIRLRVKIVAGRGIMSMP